MAGTRTSAVARRLIETTAHGSLDATPPRDRRNPRVIAHGFRLVPR
jgi:hypothetical protein